MRGLLLKDCYTLLKQLKIMLVILLVWACIPNFAFGPMAVFYAAMLPVTALAYDERSKWDELASMMPYSVRDIVLSKYLLGVGVVGAATVVSGLAQLLIAAVRGTGLDGTEAIALLLTACLALAMLGIMLPIMFRMGVEKGRIALMLVICAVVVGVMAAGDWLTAFLNGMTSPVLLVPLMFLFSAAVLAVSVPVSVRLYRKGRA